MDNMNTETGQSLYRRGAEDGLWMGIYLSLLFLAMVSSVYAAWSGIATVLMALGVPVVVYAFLRRAYRAGGCRDTFSAVWLHGICIFFFGSLLMAVTAYVFLRFVNPTYINDVVEMAKDVYSQIGTSDAKAMAKTLSQMQSGHLLPTPAQTAVQLIWSGVFTGSLLSMVLAAIVRHSNVKN